MKSNFILVTILFLFSPFAIYAEGTWVKVQEVFNANPKKGTFGYMMAKENDVYGLGWFVDAQSIVKKGQYVYFNLSAERLDRSGSIKLKDNSKITGVAWQANCSERLLKGPGNNEWKTFKGQEKLGAFVCR